MNASSLLFVRFLSLAIACVLSLNPNCASADVENKPVLRAKTATLKPNAKGQMRYIVRMKSAPLALYRGDKAGLAATSPTVTGERRLNARSAASLNYKSYLAWERNTVLQTLRAKLQREVSVHKHFHVALHGFTAELTPAEAQLVAQLPGIAKVSPDRLLRLQTDRGPRWIGAFQVWNGKTTGVPSQGEGAVVGILDSGINPANPSFADIGADGYDHVNPEGRYFGVCDPADPHYDPAFVCNDKLIGAYDFTETMPDNPFTALDTDGHGSHTASTAVGNVVEACAEAPTTVFTRRISGVAPHANLITYRVCFPPSVQDGTCPGSSDIAAIEQAILDGVDVLNHSIGGTAGANSWNDDLELAFLAAHAAGIVVTNSTGNSGPDAATIDSPATAPWLMSVGAVSHDRAIVNGLTALQRDDGVQLPDLAGKGLTTGYGPAAIVYAGNVPNSNAPAEDPGLCSEAYPEGTFHGEIVICDRGIIARVDKSSNVLAGGAGGMILVNVADGDGDVVADGHFLPATHLAYTDGQNLKDWLAQDSGHKGTLLHYKATKDRSVGDILADFSSRGQNPFLPDLLKPDLVAPGVDILAASGVNGEIAYEIKSGTSMASPHAAGAAALLKSLHPGWSPDEIKSALMITTTTTSLRNSDGKSPVNPFDSGAGRINLAAAAQTGLVMDENFVAYANANPSLGGSPSQLNLPSMAESACVVSCRWRRRVRNPGTQTITWNAADSFADGFQLKVTPASFTLAPGASQTLDISAITTLTTAVNAWRFGQVTLNAGHQHIPSVHLPVAVQFKASDLSTRLFFSGVAEQGNTTIAVTTGLAVSRLTSRASGLVPATLHKSSIHQDEQLAFDVEVAQGARRLVAEIRSAISPDLDLSVSYITAAGKERLLCFPGTGGSLEYCNLDQPKAGTYRVKIDGYTTNDPSGKLSDNFELSTGVVDKADRNNLSLTGDKKAAQGESLDLKISWDVDPAVKIWYGAFSLGTDKSAPAILGHADLDLYLD